MFTYTHNAMLRANSGACINVRHAVELLRWGQPMRVNQRLNLELVDVPGSTDRIASQHHASHRAHHIACRQRVLREMVALSATSSGHMHSWWWWWRRVGGAWVSGSHKKALNTHQRCAPTNMEGTFTCNPSTRILCGELAKLQRPKAAFSHAAVMEAESVHAAQSRHARTRLRIVHQP